MVAQQFVREGAYVFVNDLCQIELDEALKQIGKNATGVQGDVSNLADLDRLYATVKQQKGRIDILFANARLLEFAPLGAITVAHFDKIFGVNVKGLLFTVQKALPLFQDGGSIILNASAGASKGFEGSSLQRIQGRHTVLRAHLDSRSKTTQDPRQRHESWSD